MTDRGGEAIDRALRPVFTLLIGRLKLKLTEKELEELACFHPS